MAFTDFLPGMFRKADPEPVAPEPVTLTDPLASWLFGATPTYTGKSVTPINAMTVPAVSSAVELIAEAVGTLPAKLFVRDAEGKEADPAHPAFRLVHDEANENSASGALRQTAEPASLVDHVIPHKGDDALFWDRSNWQALCAHHHNSTKQREERRPVQT